MARYFGVKPNELANRMIAAGILALEREDPDYEPDFVIEYRQKVVIPKIEQYQSEKKLAEGFNPYSDVPKELERDGWAFMGLIEVTNLHNRELIDGLLGGKSVQETFSEISRDSTLSHAYLDKLRSIYTSPVYQESMQAHPLRRKKLKKEIIDAWVVEWRRMNRFRPTERSIVADITALLPGCPRTDSDGFSPRSTSRFLCIAGKGTDGSEFRKPRKCAINAAFGGSKRLKLISHSPRSCLRVSQRRDQIGRPGTVSICFCRSSGAYRL